MNMKAPVRLSNAGAFPPLPVQAVPVAQRGSKEQRLAQEQAQHKQAKRKLRHYGLKQRQLVDAKFHVAAQFEPRKGRR